MDRHGQNGLLSLRRRRDTLRADRRSRPAVLHGTVRGHERQQDLRHRRGSLRCYVGGHRQWGQRGGRHLHPRGWIRRHGLACVLHRGRSSLEHRHSDSRGSSEHSVGRHGGRSGPDRSGPKDRDVFHRTHQRTGERPDQGARVRSEHRGSMDRDDGRPEPVPDCGVGVVHCRPSAGLSEPDAHRWRRYGGDLRGSS